MTSGLEMELGLFLQPGALHKLIHARSIYYCINMFRISQVWLEKKYSLQHKLAISVYILVCMTGVLKQSAQQF